MPRKKKTYSQKIEALAKKLGVDYSIAMDIMYLRELENRIIKIAKANPNLRDFNNLYNAKFEEELDTLEDQIIIKKNGYIFYSCSNKEK